MKNITLALMTLILMSSSAFGEKYSKKEITEYIVNKLENEANNPIMPRKYKVTFTNNLCSIEVANDDNTIISLKDISVDYETTQTRYAGISYEVSFNCKNDDNCILYSTHAKNTKEYNPTGQQSAGFETNKVNQKKLYRAFNDLANYCSGTKELY